MAHSNSKIANQRYAKDTIRGTYYSLFNKSERNDVLDNLEEKLKTLDSRIAAARSVHDAVRVNKLLDARNAIVQTLARAGRVR